MFITSSLNVTPTTTDVNLFYTLVNWKSKQIIIKHCVRGIVLLKLTTDIHKASRGLSARAELLVTARAVTRCINFVSGC